MNGGVDGFEYARHEVGATAYRPGVAGSGPAVLLLHGYPQTHYCWHRVAPALATRNTVVLCDLKGYGESRSAPGGPLGEGYGKREMAAELVELMARLGHERFAVAGHDRGARAAYRMALDHPGAVERLAVLNVVPTVDQFERMAQDVSLDYYPWFLLAQPAELAEPLVGRAPSSWSVTRSRRGALRPERSPPMRPRATCARSRRRRSRGSAPTTGRRSTSTGRCDAADRAAGRTIRCPVLVHWGAEEGSMSDGPLAVWRRWAGDVRGGPLASGHFVPEEAADALVASLRDFLAG